MQEITTKRPSITPADLEEVANSTEDTYTRIEVASPRENTSPLMEETNLVGTTENTKNSNLKRVSPKGPNFIERFFGRIWGS